MAEAEARWSVNDRAQAQAILHRAIALKPNDPTLVARLARMEIATGQHGAAEVRLRDVLAYRADPAGSEVRGRLIQLLTRALLFQEKFDEASALLATVPVDARNANWVSYLQAHVCRHTCRYQEAERLYREALDHDENDLRTMRELAELLSLQRRFGEAEAVQRRLVEASGDATINAGRYSHVLLAQGRVREGWAHNMLRVECAELKKLSGLRVWNGSDLAGRSIFVIVEGGTGDEVRDAVCYRELSRRCARATVTCDPRLASLLARSFPDIRFWPLHRTERVSSVPRRLSTLIDEAALEEARGHDCCVLSPDLFRFLKPNADDYGEPFRYLVPDPQLVTRWRERLAALGPGPKIGMTWNSIRQSYRTRSYYTKLLEWRPILTAPDVVFISLQYGDFEPELRAAEQEFGVCIHRWPDLDLRDDFEQVAALVSSLDLVLAPNNTILELAGALGTRTWYLVNEYQTLDHWRLKDPVTGQDRCYRSVRMFMAERPGDSASLIAKVSTAMTQTFGSPDR